MAINFRAADGLNETPVSEAQPLPVTNVGAASGGDSYQAITTNATTVVKDGAGTLTGIVVNAIGTSETVTVYDAADADGTAIFTFALTGLAVGTKINIGAAMGTGITVKTAGSAACDITVLYR